MKIELIYTQKCSGGTILYTKDPIEEIVVNRQSRQHGPDKVTKASIQKHELYVPGGGQVGIELTKINAMFIKNAISDGLLEYISEDDEALVETMLKSKTKAVKEEEDGDEESTEGVAAKDKSPTKSKVVTV